MTKQENTKVDNQSGKPENPKKKHVSDQAYRLNIKRIILLCISAPLTLLINFAIIVASVQITASTICSSQSSLCGDYGMTFFAIAWVVCIVSAGVLFLHFLVKLSWVLSLCVAITSLTGLIICASIISGILQSDGWSTIFLSLPVILAVFYMLFSLLFLRLQKWPFVCVGLAICLVLTGIFLVIPALDTPIKKARQVYEDNKNLGVAKTLPFRIYSPTHAPTNYKLVNIQSLSDSILITFRSTDEAKSFYLKEELLAEQYRSKTCDIPPAWDKTALGKCEKVTLSACDLYRQFPSTDPGSTRFFCTINETRITLTISGDKPTQDVLKIFESMNPVAAEDLYSELIRNAPQHSDRY